MEFCEFKHSYMEIFKFTSLQIFGSSRLLELQTVFKIMLKYWQGTRVSKRHVRRMAMAINN